MATHTEKKSSKSIQVWLLTRLVRGYQLTISALAGRNCRHLPTCSAYSIEALERFGAWRGLWLSLARFVRCHPLGSSGYDPVPERLEDHGLRFWRYGVWRIENDKGRE